jgi:hypothetical protein
MSVTRRAFPLASALLAGGALLGAQQPAAPARPPSLSGVWQFDESRTTEDQGNWRRSVHAGPAAPIYSPSKVKVVPQPQTNPRGATLPQVVQTGGEPSTMTGRTTESVGNRVSRALRDLLELALTYDIRVEPTSVVIIDDLGRRDTYATSGKKEKHRAGATEFTVASTWRDGQLVQQLDSVYQLQVKRTFVPSADLKTLFVVMTVERPKLVPELKPITRVYTRPEK